MSLARAEKADLTDGGSLDPTQADSLATPNTLEGSQTGPDSRRTRARAPDSRRALDRASRSGATAVPPGGVLFVTAAHYTEASLDFAERRYLVVSLPPGATYRDRSKAIDEAVEGALSLRGALPRAPSASADAEAAVRDQVIRARALGATGIAMMFPHLSSGLEGGSLSIEESAFVSAWIAAAKRGLVVVLFDERDRDVGVLAPRRLADVASSPKPTRDSIPPPSGKIVRVTPEAGPTTLKASTLESAAPLVEEEPPTPRFRTEPPSSVVTSRQGALNKRILLAALGAKRSAADAAPASQSSPSEAPPALPEAGSPSRFPGARIKDTDTPPPPSIRPGPTTRRAGHAIDWRAHAMELDKARGPKPVGVIERLFITRYMPLLGALSRGEVDADVKRVLDGFRTDFEQSYREISSTPRVTGKRPSMVSDAPDIAAWVGRLSGARAVQLLLVDAMRFDIGERVASRLMGRAMCVERTLLWSALPTPTPAEGEMPRDRAVGTVKRERFGSTEVMRLHLVEPRLHVAGAAYEERIERLAEEVAQITIRSMDTLPAGTLLFMLGNHGFQLPCRADGRSTGAATLGGISPEEVLVPGHAWLLGGAR